MTTLATWTVRLAKSKTILFNVLTLVAMVAASDQLQTLVSAERLVQVQAVVNLLLRVLTTTSLAAKA
jgi:hypothetical protein